MSDQNEMSEFSFEEPQEPQPPVEEPFDEGPLDDFVAPDETSSADEERRKKIMIGVGVAVVLCCCCVAFVAAAWFGGDYIVGLLP